MNQLPAFKSDGTTYTRYQKKSFFIKRFFLGIFSFFLLFSVGYLSVMISLVFKTHHAAQNITVGAKRSPTVLGVAKSLITQDEIIPLKSDDAGRINILLLGKASKDYPGQDLTDTIILASIDTKTNRASLISLPRDLYVPIANSSSWTKINALYKIGSSDKEDPFSVIRDSISDITGLSIPYSLVVDYDAFVQIIDALGGINVTVERDILDTRFPGPHYSYETFELKKGFHTLDGATALKYVRERHSDPRGDFGRAERQQQTLKAVRNKMFSSQTFLNPLTLSKLLSALEDNIRTDISLDEIEGFLQLAQKTDLQNIESVVIDAWKPESLLRVSHVYLENGQRMFALAPRSGSFEEITDLAKNIFDLSSLKKRHANIQEENARVTLISYGNARIAEKIQRLLLDLGFGKVSIFYEDASRGIPEKSILLDESNRSKPYSLDEIIKVIPADYSVSSQITPELPDSFSQDIILLLGKDSHERHGWEEVSVEEWQSEIEHSSSSKE